MKRKYLIIGLGFFLFFGSELSAQQTSNHAKLSGRAVRTPLTPGLSSVRRTRLNNQVINSVLKQNTPTKAGQRQIKAIEWRLQLRAPLYVIREGRNPASRLNKVWYPFWSKGKGGHYAEYIWLFNYWANWYPR